MANLKFTSALDNTTPVIGDVVLDVDKTLKVYDGDTFADFNAPTSFENSDFLSPTIDNTISFQTSEGVVTYDVDDLVHKLKLLDRLINKFMPEELL